MRRGEFFSFRTCMAASFAFFFVFPASTNYELRNFGFGAGGEENAGSTNYSMNAMTGEGGVGTISSSSFSLGAGLSFVEQANVPPAPTFANPENSYNRLKLVLDMGSNPTDALFAIAISPDNWTTTLFVQNDYTVGAALGAEDYQTFSSWGGNTGFSVIGLLPNTSYAVKVKAMRGTFTETGYGPVASATTGTPTLSFDIDVASTDAETNPPFVVDFGTLPVNTTVTGTERIWVDFSTNAENGGKIYIASTGGLSSISAGATVASGTVNLESASSGYGAQGVSASSVSGVPLAFSAPYNGTLGNVGGLTISLRELLSSPGPLSGGRGSFVLKAKSSALTPAGSDYADTLTVVASANF